MCRPAPDRSAGSRRFPRGPTPARQLRGLLRRPIRRPFEHWAELERTYQYVRRYAPELLGGTFPEAQQATATALDDQRDEANQRKGGRPPTASKLDLRDAVEKRRLGQPSDGTVDNVHGSRPAGNSRQRALRQLRKADEEDHLPGAAELRAEVLAETRSPHSALIQLGLCPHVTTIPAGPADRVAAALRRHLPADDRVQLAALLARDSPAAEVSIPPRVDAPRGEDDEIPGTTVGLNVGAAFVAAGLEHDLFGEPKGEATTWELERLVRRRPNHKRRIREKVTITYCADGWEWRNEMWDPPFRAALCDSRRGGTWDTGDGSFDGDRFRVFHREHPVLWRIRIWAIHGGDTNWYCNPELPDEYRGSSRPHD